MKQTVNEWDFIEAFRQAGREENFSREGLSNWWTRWRKNYYQILRKNILTLLHCCGIV